MPRDLPTARRLPAHGPVGGATWDTHVTAPFAGTVVPTVRVGDRVDPGAVVATIEAIKMEAAITSPRGGTVTRLEVQAYQLVEGGDVIAELG